MNDGARKWTIGCLALLVPACAVGKGEVDIATTNSASFPGVPAAVAAHAPHGLTTAESEVTIDVKDEIDQIGAYGTLSAAVSKDSLSGSGLARVTHLRATIATKDGRLPTQVLCDMNIAPGSTSVELVSPMPDDLLLGFLREGPVVLHFSLTAAMTPQALVLTHTLDARIGISVASSVAKM